MNIGVNYKKIVLLVSNVYNQILSLVGGTIDSLQKDIERIDGNVTSCNTGISEINERITTMGNTVNNLQSTVLQNSSDIENLLNTPIGSNDWVEITRLNGVEGEITQEFSEIRMLAKCTSGNSYTVTVPYDAQIFHNSQGGGTKYITVGNPIENNYGCKFMYMVNSGKGYVGVDRCFDGGSFEPFDFRAWIKPSTSTQ